MESGGVLDSVVLKPSEVKSDEVIEKRMEGILEHLGFYGPNDVWSSYNGMKAKREVL